MEHTSLNLKFGNEIHHNDCQRCCFRRLRHHHTVITHYRFFEIKNKNHAISFNLSKQEEKKLVIHFNYKCDFRILKHTFKMFIFCSMKIWSFQILKISNFSVSLIQGKLNAIISPPCVRFFAVSDRHLHRTLLF